MKKKRITWKLLARTQDAAKRNYLKRSDVVGVSVGTKFSNGLPTQQVSIQFFVVQKSSEFPRERALPAFIYGRAEDGGIDHSVRIPTDVIEVGAIDFSCGGGSQVNAPGERGTITLIFQNKVQSDNRFFLLTCAHVAGDVLRSPPGNPELRATCQNEELLAMTIKNSTQKRGSVEYDIALAEIDGTSPSLVDRLVVGDNIQLDGFIQQRKLRPSLGVRCMLAMSKHRLGNIHSCAGAVIAWLDNRRYTLHNVYMIQTLVQPGDSGGIVYTGTKAVGFIVARSPQGWAWFQPLEPAIKYLSRIEPKFPLLPF
jgi:hypothetical protein